MYKRGPIDSDRYDRCVFAKHSLPICTLAESNYKELLGLERLGSVRSGLREETLQVGAPRPGLYFPGVSHVEGPLCARFLADFRSLLHL